MAKVNNLREHDLSSLRSAVSAGEPLNREVIQVFQDNFDIKVRDGYGQTESTLLIGTLVDTPIRPGSMGKPIMPEYMAIIDAEGNPVGVGEIGDIAMRRDFQHFSKSTIKNQNVCKKRFAVIISFLVTALSAMKIIITGSKAGMTILLLALVTRLDRSK